MLGVGNFNMNCASSESEYAGSCMKTITNEAFLEINAASSSSPLIDVMSIVMIPAVYRNIETKETNPKEYFYTVVLHDDFTNTAPEKEIDSFDGPFTFLIGSKTPYDIKGITIEMSHTDSDKMKLAGVLMLQLNARCSSDCNHSECLRLGR